jgi:hypothetical protein
MGFVPSSGPFDDLCWNMELAMARIISSKFEQSVPIGGLLAIGDPTSDIV